MQVVVDNLNNSSDIAIGRVKELAGEYGNNLYFHKLDLRDKPALQKLFAERKIMQCYTLLDWKQ